MEKYEIEKLRDLPIEEVAERLGLQVVRHKALCPFHDDHHASLTFNTRKNRCRCFVCMDKSMDNFDLVMASLHVDFIVASRWLADKFGIPISGRKPTWTYIKRTPSASERMPSTSERMLSASERTPSTSDRMPSASERMPSTALSPHPFDASRYARFFEHPWLSDEARKFLFEERKIDERVVRWCRLTSWQDREGTHWLQTPYFDIGGKLIGIQNRNLDYQKKSSGKGLSPFDKEQKPTAEGLTSIAMGKASSAEGLSPFDKEQKPTAEGLTSTAMGKAFSDKGLSPFGKEKKPTAEGLTSTAMGKAFSDKEQKPRFRFPLGAKCSIYNLPVIARMKVGDELYITEGCSDCWAMLSAGHKAIAIPSATLLSPEDKRLLTELSRRLSIEWHMYPDKDAPGERLFLQLKELLPSLVHHQLPPDSKDFGDFYKLGVRSYKSNQ